MGAVIGALALLAAAGAWLGGTLLVPGAVPTGHVLVPLLVLGVAGVQMRQTNLGPHLGVSVTSVVLAAAVALAGPVGAAVVGGVAHLCDLRAQKVRTRLFNTAMAAAMGALGGVVYLVAAQSLATTAPLTVPLLQVGVPLLLAHAAMTVLNAVSIGFMAAAVRGSHVLTVAAGALRSLGWGTLTHLIIGFLFVVLWVGASLGPFSAVFVLGPLVVAHWSIGREALARREHQETVTSFVAALEEADPVSVGHSARVADLADRMAGILDVGGQAAEDLRYAALLHDIGLVTVRPELPPDAEPHDIAYLSAVSGHPEAGVAVLRDLDFLTGALPAIAHHHERFDGRGYPAGLAGESIPLAARIIAVADAYDALTAEHDVTSVSSAAAVEELRARCGTQFDPAVVDALAEVLERAEVPQPRTRGRGPVPELPPPALAAEPGTRRGSNGWDHDHPSVSDTFAEWQPEAGVRAS